jgi:protein O-mannosyl-transferase
MRWIINANKSRMFVWAGAIVIIAGCFAAYIPAIKSGFIWDDDVYVTNNPLLAGPNGLYRIWLTTESPSQYFPLTYTAFWVEHKLWEFNPAGYHAVNIAIHIANALLLWLILRRLSIPWAWFAAAVFALHPVQVESAAWVTELKNLLMLFFSLLSVLCWMESALFQKYGRKAYAASLLLFALALTSKTTACMLPLVLVLILWFKRVPLTAKRWFQTAPFFAMSLAMGYIAMGWEMVHQGTNTVNLAMTSDSKIVLAGRALWFYLWKLFWPTNLTFSYPRWNIDLTQIQQYAWPAAFLLVLYISYRWRNRLGTGPFASLLFFALVLIPMLGFFKLYTFVYTYAADHYQYAACIGPIALAAACGERISRRLGTNGKIVLFSAAGILLITLGVLTWRQSGVYVNEKVLWEDTLKKNPDSWLAHGIIMDQLIKQGKFEEAKNHAEQRIKLGGYTKAIDPHIYASFYFNLATILEAQNKLDEAVNYYQQSIEIYNNYALAHYRLGKVLYKQGNNAMAMTHLRRVIEITKNEKNEPLAEASIRIMNSIENRKQNRMNQ